MKKPGPPPGLMVFGSVMKWTGLFGIGFGGVSSVFAVGSFFTEADAKWMVGHINKAALALMLGGMFFMVAGSGLVLISRPLVPVSPERPLRWPRILAYGLYAYSAAVFGLAVILIIDLGDATSGRIVAGLVAYCVLVAIGLLISSWGLKRFADVG
jgi:hypothetical protein